MHEKFNFEKIPFIALALIFCMIPIGGRLVVLSILLFVAVTLLFGNWNKWKVRFREFLPDNIPILLFFLIYLLGLLISDNTENALSQIEHKSSLVIFPLVLPFLNIQKKHVHECFKIFVLSCFLILIISFLNFLYTTVVIGEYCILGEKPEGNRIGTVYEYLSKHFIVVEIHRSYFSIYLILCLAYICCYFENFNLAIKKTPKWLAIIIAFFFSLSIVFIQAKMAWIILVATGLVLLSWKGTGYRRYLLAIIPLLIVSSIALKNVVKDRFEPMLHQIENVLSNGDDSEKKFAKELRPGSTETRYMLYKSSFQLIKKKPWLGYGMGDVKDVLRAQNEQNRFKSIAHLNYGPHSQFLYSWLGFGVVGVLIFCVFILSPIWRGFKRSNGFVFVVGCIFGLACVAESFLSRQEGIVPTALILSVIPTLISNFQSTVVD
nr:O-antigen ligase family protein [Allomuricauda sp.]